LCKTPAAAKQSRTAADCLTTITSYFSTLCYLFQLLHKEAGRRLGSGPGGSDEIQKHKWFKSVNWKRLEARQIEPSFRPNVAGKTCIANFDKCWTNMSVLDSPVASPVAANSNFVGYSYVRPAPFLQKPSPLG
jgi:ribosomal protein S6 kinase beta